MNVFEQDGVFKTSRISGPKHNYLGISFADESVDSKITKKCVEIDSNCLANVRGEDVLRIVQEVVMIEAAKYNCQLHVATIEFVPTDTDDIQTYRELATAITLHALERRGCVRGEPVTHS